LAIADEDVLDRFRVDIIELGRGFTFWGDGCDTRDILLNGTPEQVAEHVKEQIKTLKKDGDFVFQQVHNILANVSPENIVAMFDAVKAID
jgi:uroporphyrinogen decarboxylase